MHIFFFLASLQASMIEIADPYCSSLGMFSLSHSVTANILAFSGIPIEKLNQIVPKYVRFVFAASR